MRTRQGFTLPEVLVTLVVLGVIGASLAQVMTVQSRLYQRQEGRSAARGVSRGATTIMLSDLRMVETGGGVTAASPTSITVRVPYAFGILCEAGNNGNVTAAMAPVNSQLLAEIEDAGSRSGFAWRGSTGAYSYVDGGTVGAGSASVCTTDNIITNLTGGRVIQIGAMPSSAEKLAPIFLYQVITYSFSNSASVPGQLGLWRTVPNRQPEEIAAPFDATAAFRFYVDGSSTPLANPPASLSDIRGLQLQLTAINERVPVNTLQERATYMTAVFFKNRT